MKLIVVLFAFVAYGALMLTGNTSNAASISVKLVDSKVQPTQVELAKDSKSDTWGVAKFDHVTHSTKNYSIDGTSVIGCAECHHTDQPSPKPPLKLSERKEVLTAANLAAGDSVKSCRTCHFQADSDKKQPTITYEGESDSVELTNEEAYHRNCNTCHDAVKARKPNTTAPTKCDQCHMKKA